MNRTHVDIEWRPVLDFAGLYEVSNSGLIRSIPRSGTRGGIIKTSSLPKGYVHVTLSKDGRRYSRTVHQLVARAFLVQPSPDEMVRHRNGVPSDNRAENLQWGTAQDNADDKIRHGTSRKLVTHCPRDHALIEPNLVRSSLARGMRSCRSCAAGFAAVQSGRSDDMKSYADLFYSRLDVEQ